ncbi:MAG: class I SAM-dependent methyltransferase [Candidatus Binataceae bacterium]
MSAQAHWNRLYQTKGPAETSWYEPHLEISLEWIIEAAPDRNASVIDVGGGESTLVDDLLAQGYRALTVLDLSETALENAQRRLGDAARNIAWIPGDAARMALPPHAFDLWHDRAVFHFFTDPEERAAYMRRLSASLRHGGQVMMATFGPDGPEKCSGLPTMRYSADSLSRELGPEFRLVRQALVDHRTPFGTAQQFLYCQFDFRAE